MTIWAQANAALVDASGGVSASTVVTIASTVVTAVSVAIAVIFRQYIAQLTGTIAKQDAELQKLNDRLKFSAQKIDAMVAEKVMHWAVLTVVWKEYVKVGLMDNLWGLYLVV